MKQKHFSFKPTMFTADILSLVWKAGDDIACLIGTLDDTAKIYQRLTLLSYQQSPTIKFQD